jgi:hypothetical protein
MHHMRAEHVCQVYKMPVNISSSFLRIRGSPVSQADIASLSPRRSGLQNTTFHLGFVLQEVTLVQVLCFARSDTGTGSLFCKK